MYTIASASNFLPWSEARTAAQPNFLCGVIRRTDTEMRRLYAVNCGEEEAQVNQTYSVHTA